MTLIEQLIAHAKNDKQRIVLPEGTEERTLKAANQILTDGVADLILLGNPDQYQESLPNLSDYSSVHGYAGLRDPLYYKSHNCTPVLSKSFPAFVLIRCSALSIVLGLLFRISAMVR